MNAVTQLLAGAALGALASVPALAGDAPDFHVVALHAGKVVTKTLVRDPARQHVTYTLGIYTSLAAQLDKKVKIPFPYRWNGSGREKFKVAPKKTACATIGKYTYSTGDGGVGYGTTYKLTNPDCHTDSFVSTLIGWFQNGGVKYKGTMNADYTVNLY